MISETGIQTFEKSPFSIFLWKIINSCLQWHFVLRFLFSRHKLFWELFTFTSNAEQTEILIVSSWVANQMMHKRGRKAFFKYLSQMKERKLKLLTNKNEENDWWNWNLCCITEFQSHVTPLIYNNRTEN